MIRLPPVVSTLARLLIFLLCAGCTALPTFDPGPPLAAALSQSDTVFTLSDGVSTPVRQWLPPAPPRAVVLALHGFNDSRDAWALPGPVFAAAGITLYAPDQRGFGGGPNRGFWPGGDTLAADAAAMLAGLRARHPGIPLYAMGESMAGAVLMTLAAGPAPPLVDGWILLSPAVWGRQQQGVVLSNGLWLVSSVTPGLMVTGGEVVLRVTPSDNRAALLALARNPLTIRRTRFDTLRGLTDLMDDAQAAAPKLPPRTLVLYGDRDTIVPGPAVSRAWRAMPGHVRRALYPGGYHLLLRDLGRAAPTADVIAWIGAQDSWLPSGADMAAAGWQAVGR